MARSAETEDSVLQQAFDLIRGVKAAVERCCKGRDGEIFLTWFRRKCGAHKTTQFHPDPYVHAFNAGKRAAFQELADILTLTDEQLCELTERKFPR